MASIIGSMTFGGLAYAAKSTAKPSAGATVEFLQDDLGDCKLATAAF